MQMAIPLYLTTIEQDIFDTFRYLPHAVAVGVGFVTVAAAWKNQQMPEETETAGAVRVRCTGAQLLAVVSGSQSILPCCFRLRCFPENRVREPAWM